MSFCRLAAKGRVIEAGINREALRSARAVEEALLAEGAKARAAQQTTAALPGWSAYRLALTVF